MMGDLIMNNNYYFKDILFGLRNEYLMLQEELDTLKKYVNLEDNDLENVSFYLDTRYPDKVLMRCILYDKMSKIQERIEKIKIKLGIYPDYKTSDIVECNGKYDIEIYPEIIYDGKKQEFNQSIFYIFNTDFVKNLRYIHYGIGYDDKPFLSLSSSNISFYLNEYVSMNYNLMKGDYLHFYSSRGILTKDIIDNVFNTEFPKKRFPKYYQDLIEECSLLDRSIDIVGDLGYSKKGDFEIIDESKRLVLRKK